MLAIIEDGFSHLETVQTSRKSGSTAEGGGEGGIGASNIFALLGVTLKGQIRGKKESEEQALSTQERIHTPTSLFAKLYQRLNDSSSIVKISDPTTLKGIKPGDIVEFSGLLRKNPLLYFLETSVRIVEMMATFDQPNYPVASKKNKGPSENEKLLDQIRSMAEELRAGVVVDLLCSLTGSLEIRAVIPVYHTYFFNETMSEVIDGEYRVLGKITRIVHSEEDGEINLLRYTGLGLYQRQIIEQMTSQFKDAESSGMNFGEMTTVVTAPAFQVIPIAIFV